MLENSWTVNASHVSFDTPVPLEYAMPQVTFTMMEVALPYIILPSELARILTAATGAVRGPAWFESVPCERRQELPDFTITLGMHNFTITAFDYVLEVTGVMVYPGERVCLPTFMAADEFGIGDHAVVLGHLFMRGFYSKWDFGKEIGRKWNRSLHNHSSLLTWREVASLK